MGNKIKWGVLGCAGIAKGCFIPGILKAGNAELYAIASRSASDKLTAFQNEFHPVKTYESYEALLDDADVQAVYIPLPNGLHAEWTIKALNKKKHVMCEKPMGATPLEAIDMQQAAEKNGVWLMEAFAYLHSPLTARVKELVDNGAIGSLRFIDGHFTFNNMAATNVRYSADLAGGATFDVGCYPISLIRYLVGTEPTGIVATGTIGSSGVDITSCTTLLFEGGITAVAYCSFEDFRRSEYTVLGENGVIRVPFPFNYEGTAEIIIETADSIKKETIECPHNYMLEVEQFGRVIADGEKPFVSPAFTLGNAVVIDEILRQIR